MIRIVSRQCFVIATVRGYWGVNVESNIDWIIWNDLFEFRVSLDGIFLFIVDTEIKG